VRHGIIGINRICFLFCISKATYYQCKHPNESFLAKYEAIKRSVEKVIKDNAHYGIRRIKSALFEDYHVSIGRDTLGKLLKLWGLSLQRKIKPRKISVIQKILQKLADRTNLLIHSTITAPVQAITSDITELRYANGKLKCYLAVHKDVFGQMVYGYAVAEHMDAALVMKSFRNAISRIRTLMWRIPKTILFHQDQGSQYTGYAYVEAALGVGTLSYSTPGTPTENPGQESFFGRFKDEWKDEIHELQTYQEVVRFIDEKIHYYNNRRLHTSIGNRAPLAYTKSVLSTGM